MARDNIVVNDRQLACARINSQEGQDYLVRPHCVRFFLFLRTAVCHGLRSQLRVGESQLDDVPLPPSK